MCRFCDSWKHKCDRRDLLLKKKQQQQNGCCGFGTHIFAILLLKKEYEKWRDFLENSLVLNFSLLLHTWGITLLTIAFKHRWFSAEQMPFLLSIVHLKHLLKSLLIEIGKVFEIHFLGENMVLLRRFCMVLILSAL